jgi:hypothetical protein
VTREIAYPLVIDALWKRKAIGEAILAFCSGRVKHTRALDMDELIAALGEDFDIVENRSAFISRLACPVCGAIGGDIVCQPMRRR